MLDEKMLGKLVWRDSRPHFEQMDDELCYDLNSVLLALIRDSLKKFANSTMYIYEEGYIALISDAKRLEKIKDTSYERLLSVWKEYLHSIADNFDESLDYLIEYQNSNKKEKMERQYKISLKHALDELYKVFSSLQA